MSYNTTLMTEWCYETTDAMTEIYSHSIPINNMNFPELSNNKDNITNKNKVLDARIKDLKSVGTFASADKCIEYMCDKCAGPFDSSVPNKIFTIKNLLKITTCDDKTLIPTHEVSLIETYGMTFKKKVEGDGTLSWDFC